MKHVLLLCLICTGLATHAQFGGIGKFKIGIANSSVITKLSSETKVPVKVFYKNPDNYAPSAQKHRKTSAIFLISKPSVIKDSTVKYGDWYVDLPEVKTYFVDYMEIAKVPVVRTFFYFYKDTLYKIRSNQVPKDFIDAVKLKYGEGTTYNSSTNFNCNESGVSKRLTGVNTSMSWMNEGIRSDYFYSEMFDTNCKPLYLTTFNMVNERMEEQVKQSIEEVKKKKKEEESNRRIKALEDF